MEPKEKSSDVNPDADGFDASPEFWDSLEDFDQEWFDENDPEFGELLKKHNKEENAD
jgi:hypothetical protein